MICPIVETDYAYEVHVSPTLVAVISKRWPNAAQQAMRLSNRLATTPPSEAEQDQLDD